MGQSRPFPQNVTYPNGCKTSVISTTVLQNAYNRWKNSFLKSYQGMYRVCGDDTTITISEGMGYGMLLTGNFWKPELSDDYLGQTPPGESAVMFSEGFISKGNVHRWLAISPIGDELFWTTVSDQNVAQIMHTVKRDGNWCEPEIPSFASHGMTNSPLFSPYENKLFFKYMGDNNQWEVRYVEKTDTGWSVPRNDGFLINPTSSFTESNKVYYTDTMAGKPWDRGIYCAQYSDTGYVNIQPLDATINSPYIDYTPFISPDESYLLFSSSRPSSNEDMYLFISFRKGDGTWSTPEKIHNAINFSGNARFPSISPDGKYLFFCSDDGNIYWVDIHALNKLNPTHVKKSEIPPNGFQLYQNYPNPFNPSTLINYQLQVSGSVKLNIYNTLGQKAKTLVDSYQHAGQHFVVWDGTDNENNPVVSGIYLYRLDAGESSLQKKLTLIR
jgi:hypothetical protein